MSDETKLGNRSTKIRIDIGDKGLQNSRLFVEGKEVAFSKLALVIDGPGSTSLRVTVPNRQAWDQAGSAKPILEGELSGHIEPGNIELRVEDPNDDLEDELTE